MPAICPDRLRNDRSYRPFLVVFLLVLLASSTLHAASFSLSPIRAMLDKKGMARVTVSNREGDAPITLSVKPFAWSQNALGEDVIAPTADIVVFPKIVTIKKGEERVVRLAVADGKPDPGKAYRVYFEEQPEIGLKPESYKVRVYAKAGISVFFVPPKTEEQLVIERIDTMQDKVVVKLVNKGAGFSKPQKVAILCRSANNIAAFRHEIDAWYLLAGASRSYTFPLPQDVQGRIQQVDVTVTTEEKTISGSAHVSSQPTTSQ